MPPTLSDKKIRKDASYAGAVKGGVITGGIKKPSPSPKSPTRSSLRQKSKEPAGGPLPDTEWEAFGSSKKSTYFSKEQSDEKTAECVACHKLWKRNHDTGERKLWGYCAERKAEHFYPGLIIRAMDSMPQTWHNAPIDDPDTASHNEGPVYAKKRPMVVLWASQRDIFCLPIRSLSNSVANFSKDPTRWQEFISATTVDDTDWKGKTPWAGPPLTFLATEKKHTGLHKQCFIQLTRPIVVQMQSEMQMNMGRLSGSDYCRLIQAYSYSQNLHKQKAFEEYGQMANLVDGTKWDEGEKSAQWQLREKQMDLKKPVVVDKTTKTYKLQ
ncbi:hypothetical protein M436DRAFT_45840 [Aureobasidium namibiae CBS 147.97]|uniref:Uncharacterized protein n=1 Tax=Aureobasidium namibiae CBS 147.97 TaxID=1043004 RepID=A0A074WJK4_9PEZI